MDTAAQTPTLLVFTLDPERERRCLLPAPLGQAEAMLRWQGLRGALEAGRQAGCRIVVSSPQPLSLPPGVEQLEQHGRSFSDRLRGAIRALQANLPNSPLLVVGTDAPDLSAQHLRAALAFLDHSPEDVVIGPSRDGGFYLLATRVALDGELGEVRWCRPDTRASLLAALVRSRRRVHCLETLQDLDRFADVEIWLASRRSVSEISWLIRLLSSLLADWRRPWVLAETGRPNHGLAAAISGRSPPL